MRYESWPNLDRACPCCGKACCAVYRGYYTRFLACPVLGYFGQVVVRTGYCRGLGIRFSLFPDFLIRYLRISKLGVLALQSFQMKRTRLLDVISDWTERMPEAFDLPLSTAYAYLSVKLALPP